MRVFASVRPLTSVSQGPSKTPKSQLGGVDRFEQKVVIIASSTALRYKTQQQHTPHSSSVNYMVNHDQIHLIDVHDQDNNEKEEQREQDLAAAGS